MMVPSGIRRDPSLPLRTRVIENGTIVVENAYEGFYVLSEEQDVRVPISGLSVANGRSKTAIAPL